MVHYRDVMEAAPSEEAVDRLGEASRCRGARTNTEPHT